ncbi:MAG: PQQ-binding-like beta-propeller repeat protein [bacterium]
MKIMMKSGRWILVGSLVSILMMGGLGLAMGKKVEKEEATAQVEEKQIEMQQKQVETEQKGEEKAKAAVTKEAKSEIREPKLIWSKEFEGGIEDVVISDVFTKGGEIAGVPAKTVFPIKVVVTGGTVKFFNEEEKVTNEILLEEYEQSDHAGGTFNVTEGARLSPDGEYIITSHYGYGCIERQSVYDKNGQFVKDIEIPGDLIFSPDGKRVVVISEWGTGFYDSRTWELKKEYESFPLLHRDSGRFSADSNYFIANSEGRIILFDTDGNVIWKRDIKPIPLVAFGNKVAISQDGDMIYAEAWRTLYCFDKSGRVIWEYKLPRAVRGITLTADENCLVVSLWDKDIYFFDSKQGVLLWQKKVDFPIASLYNSNDDSFISVGLKSGGIVVCLFKGEKIIWKKELEVEANWIIPPLNISPNGKFITIKTNRGIYVYEN